MTKQERNHIRAELARRMGWTGVEVGIDHYFFVGHPPNEPISSQRTYVPDPFTSAEDKDALVAWLAVDNARWTDFYRELESDLQIPEGEVRIWRAMWLMTAPLETITLAAARALGIPEVKENCYMTQEQLQELTADIAQAIQEGATYDTALGAVLLDCEQSPRFAAEVISPNEILVTDSDDKQYLVTIKERNNHGN